jgi:hypothetical protein
MATRHSRFVELDRIMAMPLTQDEQLVLRHLISGESPEEIAATLNWPLQVVRWTCTYPLITWVLDELDASTPADSPPPRKRTGMKDAAPAAVGYAIGLVSDAFRFLVMFVVGGAIVLGFAYALGFLRR